MLMKKTILITGASSGIGKVAAKHFASKGWQVAATLRQPEKETELSTLPGIKLYSLDVTHEDSIQAAMAAALHDFGRIDVVVNNAGFGADGVFEAMNDAFIQRQFETNVFGLMRVTRAAIKLMREQGGGTIVQIASVGGQVAFPLYSIYHATKWAVEGFTESLQFELSPLNIRVKIIEPGAIKTEFYGTSRAMVKPSDTGVYDAFVEKCERINQAAGATGADPMVVAKTIFRAVTDGSSRLRYPVAYPANVLLPLKRFLPAWLYFWFVRSNYKV